MNPLNEQRCFNHRGREAVARCPQCRNYYCRECVTEHEGRVLCATCVASIEVGKQGISRRRSLVRPLLAAVSFAFLWICFLLLGEALLALPDAFHDGTVWSSIDAPEASR